MPRLPLSSVPAPDDKVPAPANLRDALRKIMKEHNYDPFREMILIAKDPDSDRRLRATMASELAQYIAPKLKGIDIDAKASGSIQIIVQRFAEEVMQDEEPKTLDLGPEEPEPPVPPQLETRDEKPRTRRKK